MLRESHRTVSGRCGPASLPQRPLAREGVSASAWVLCAAFSHRRWAPSPSAGCFHTPALDLPETSTQLQPFLHAHTARPSSRHKASSQTLPRPGFPEQAREAAPQLRPRTVSSRVATPGGGWPAPVDQEAHDHCKRAGDIGG